MLSFRHSFCDFSRNLYKDFSRYFFLLQEFIIPSAIPSVIHSGYPATIRPLDASVIP